MTGDLARRGAIWCGARNHCSAFYLMERCFLLLCTPSHDVVHPVLGHVGGSGGVSAFNLWAAHEHSACTKHMCWVQTEQLLCFGHCMRVHDHQAKAEQ